MSIIGEKTKHPFISLKKKVSGGQPVIGGTRIKVLDISFRYEFMGWSADRIIDEYPHLKLEQVYDALSYYYEHKDFFNNKLREDTSFLTQLKKKHPSKLEAKLK